MHIEEKLKALGYTLVPAKLGEGKIEPAVRTGNLIFTSGRVPEDPRYVGKVGQELTLEQGYEAARLCALNGLSAIKALVGDLDRVTRVVKVFGMVNAADGFVDTPQVIHGCTDLLNELYGERGRHARSAVGLYQLPRNVAVEIEMIVEVSD